MGYIYRHIRLDTNQPFYIGIGRSDDGLFKRAYDTKGRNKTWLNIYKKADCRVDIILERISNVELFEKEKEFIKLYGRRVLGTGTLCNMTDGGEGALGFSHSEETKNRISQAGKGRKVSQENIEKLRLRSIGKKMSPEFAEKLRLVNTGRKQSNETIEKRVAKIKGLKRSVEQIANMKGKVGKWMLGRKLSDETKAKISLKSSNPSDETRKKLSEVSLGRKHSPATIEKMKLAQVKTGWSYEKRNVLGRWQSSLSTDEMAELRIKQDNGRHKIYVDAFCVGTDEYLGEYTLTEFSKKYKIGRSSIFRNITRLSKNPLRFYFKITKRT